MLYAMMFSDGWIKVGFSSSIAKRTAIQIAEKRRLSGALLVDQFSCQGTMDDEHRSINMIASKASDRRGDEWFFGIDFSDVKKILLESTNKYDCFSFPFFEESLDVLRDGNMVSINDLVRIGNKNREKHGLPSMTVQQVVGSSKFKEAVTAAQSEWMKSESEVVQVINQGSQSRTMAHLSVAVAAASLMSPEFHAKIIKDYITFSAEELRENGGTEFPQLNSAIDLYLEKKGSEVDKEIFNNVAKALRKKLIGTEDGCWNTATVAQTHSRYEAEKTIVKMLSLGVIRDYEHLKEVISRM